RRGPGSTPDYAATQPVPQSARLPPRRSRAHTRPWPGLVPAQQHEFGREAGPHRHQDAPRIALRRFGPRVTQNVQHRGRREVADLAERAPRQFEGIVFEVEGIAYRLETLRSAGVRPP